MADARKALVLSAGGMFAAYQAGVYKALWPHWRPDIVVGASAGALNAWLVAAGLTPDELIRQWLDPASAQTIKVHRFPAPWKGYFDAAPLRRQARRLQREYPRKLSLGIVSIEVPRFHPRLFRDDEITPEHLVATCAIPLLYPMVRINGCRLIDGGIFDPTPVWAAAAMGATEIVAINCLPRLLPWPFGPLLERTHRMRKMPVPSDLNVRWVIPSGYLGGPRESMTWERGNVERWIRMGVSDGGRQSDR
jgi:NTE family protein